MTKLNGKATPAQILQYILEKKWSLDENDKDMIVMQHQFIYEIDGQVKHLHSSLILEEKIKHIQL